MWQLKVFNKPFLWCSYSGLGGQSQRKQEYRKQKTENRNCQPNASSEKCGMFPKGAILVHEHPHCITTVATPGDAGNGNATRLILALRICCMASSGLGFSVK